MRTRVVTLAMALLVPAALVVTMIPAGAGTTDAEQAFCDKYEEGSTSLSAGDPSPGEGDIYRDLAKVAPKKSIKKALKNIAKYFDTVEDIESDDQDAVTDLFSSPTYAKYVKSATKFSNYLSKTCDFRSL